MRGLPKYIFTTCLIATFIGCPPQLLAETAELETTFYEKNQTLGELSSPIEFMYRVSSTRYFFLQFDGGEVPPFSQSEENAHPQFENVVTKDREDYRCNRLFRGVVQFGDKYYGFALDRNFKGTDEEESGEAMFGEEKELLSGQELIDKPQFTRLYFDLNGNSDLTDDEPIISEMSWLHSTSRPIITSFFPRVELEIESDGVKYEYAFLFETNVSCHEGELRCQVAFKSAAYRSGEIQLNGRTYAVALVDYNVNGRFDDFASITRSTPDYDENFEGTLLLSEDEVSGRFPGSGDRLFLDPNPRGISDPSNASGQNGCYPLAPWIAWEEKLYDVTVRPSGNTLTLKPSATSVGFVKNSEPNYSALLFNDQGVMAVRGDESGRAILPTGDWRLLSYRLDWTNVDWERTIQEDSKPGDNFDEIFEIIANYGFIDSDAPKPTYCEGQGLWSIDPVTVVEGETIELLFGLPYRVEIFPTLSWAGGVSIRIELVGAMGEKCTRIKLDGKAPPMPYYVVTNAQGEEVCRERFSSPFFSGLYGQAYWSTPAEPDPEYVITIEGINTGPFTVEPGEGAVIKLPPQSDQPTDGMW